MVDYYEKIKVAIVMGSENDMGHAGKIKEELDAWKIKSYYRIGSAHRSPGHVMDIIEKLNKSTNPRLIVSIAGGTDALSGLIAANSIWPVVSCPPSDRCINSCLENPSGTSNATILNPKNVARFAAQYFSSMESGLADELYSQIGSRRRKIIESDRKYGGLDE